MTNRKSGPETLFCKTTLITGAAGGIGKELAKIFAREGYDLILVDRTREELEQVRDILQGFNLNMRIFILEQDLTEHDAAGKVYEFTRTRSLQVSVLVNCAGFGTYGFVNEIDNSKELEMLQLHVMTLYRLNRLYLKEMLDHDDGRIINVSSISAFQPNPYFATYGASKSFILQFSRALNYELKEKKKNVRVLTVCPTAVKDTGFKLTAGMEYTRAFSSWMAVSAKDVARDTYKAMLAGKDVVIPGRGFGLLRSLVCRLPTSWLMRISCSQLKEVHR